MFSLEGKISFSEFMLGTHTEDILRWKCVLMMIAILIVMVMMMMMILILIAMEFNLISNERHLRVPIESPIEFHCYHHLHFPPHHSLYCVIIIIKAILSSDAFHCWPVATILWRSCSLKWSHTGSRCRKRGVNGQTWFVRFDPKKTFFCVLFMSSHQRYSF